MATKKNTPQQQDAPADYSTLAGHIAAILADPLTPARVYNALTDEVNSLGAPRGYHDSAEYVEACLTAHGRLVRAARDDSSEESRTGPRELKHELMERSVG